MLKIELETDLKIPNNFIESLFIEIPKTPYRVWGNTSINTGSIIIFAICE